MKYIFLLNQFSLKEETIKLKNKIEKICKTKKYDYKIEINNKDTSTEDILQKYDKSTDVIFAVGGDGTINRILNKIVNTNNILGYIPYGTGNDFYRTNKELLKKGINTIDLVKINDKYFINIACFGIDAIIGNNEDMIHSSIIPKKYRYTTGLLTTFIKYKHRYFEITINNKTIKDYFNTVAICNARYYGGGYRVSPNSSLNDGKLEVILAYKTNKIKMAKIITGMKTAKHLNSSTIEVIETDKLTIKSNKKISANIDGEILISDIFKINLIEKGLKVYYDQELIDAIIN